MTEQQSEALQAWLAGKITPFGFKSELLNSDDSIRRLKLSGRTENALVRSGVHTISLLIDIVDEPIARMGVRGIGDKGWREIEEALERPLPPMQQQEP